MTIYPEPREMWLRRVEGGFPHRYMVIGETQQSWLLRSAHRPAKWLKREYIVMDPSTAEPLAWVCANRYKLGRAVMDGHHDYETLRKIADLIGYVEGEL
jgi:hypothetical protein